MPLPNGAAREPSLPALLATPAHVAQGFIHGRRSFGAGEVLVIVGPEGGIADEELAVLAGAGAVTVRLGPEVLRASTAGPVALGWLAARIGRWA